jgi:predicted N-acetyltransferase YhbS
MKKSKINQGQRFNSRLIIRPERENDYPKIREVNDSSFGQENEGRLIEKLRPITHFFKC